LYTWLRRKEEEKNEIPEHIDGFIERLGRTGCSPIGEWKVQIDIY